MKALDGGTEVSYVNRISENDKSIIILCSSVK